MITIEDRYKEALDLVQHAENRLNDVLESMVKVGKAKIIPDQDGSYEFYVVGPQWFLDDVQYIFLEGEDFEYWGVDEGGSEEAKEQGCDPDEFCDVIVIPPGENVRWFIKRRC